MLEGLNQWQSQPRLKYLGSLVKAEPVHVVWDRNYIPGIVFLNFTKRNYLIIETKFYAESNQKIFE